MMRHSRPGLMLRGKPCGRHREKLRSLVAQAVDVLAEDMAATLEPKLSQSTAIHVLKTVGLYGQDMYATVGSY